MTNAYLNNLTSVSPGDLEVALIELNFPPPQCSRIYEKLYAMQRATGSKRVVARDLVPDEGEEFKAGRWMYHGMLYGELSDARFVRADEYTVEVAVVVDGHIHMLNPDWEVRIFHLPLKPKEA